MNNKRLTSALTPLEAQNLANALNRGMSEASERLNDLTRSVAYAMGQRDARLGLGGYYSGPNVEDYLAGLTAPEIVEK